MKSLKVVNSSLTRRVLVSLGMSVFLFANVPVFAADCGIKESPAPAITKYVSALDKALDDLYQKSGDSSCRDDSGKKGLSTDLRAGADSITKYTNRGISEDNPVVSGQFWVNNIVKGEVPAGINRDLGLLKNKQDAINSAFDRIASRCALDLSSDNADYPTIGEYLGALLTNHVKIMRIFKQSAVGDPYQPTASTYLLVEWTNFESDLSTAYGPNAAAVCRKNEDFWKKITEAFDRIGQSGGGISKGVQQWKDAWSLLNASDKQARAKEREILTRHLSSEGLSQNGAKRILRNLDSFNQKDEHRGLTGFAEDVGNSVYKLGNVIQNAYTSVRNAVEQSKSTDEYMNRKKEYQSLSIGIGAELAGDYERFKSTLGGPSLLSDENLAHLIDTHVLLKESSETLQKYEKVSSQACNSVSPGKGNCTGK